MKKINSYLRSLKLRLWIRGMADAETLAEIEGHLLDAMDQGIREGLNSDEAEQRAIECFGSVQTIIGSFEKERTNIMNKILLVVAILCGIFLAYMDSSPGWDDTGITVIGLLTSAGLITLLGHPRPWLIAFAVGLWIPLRYIYMNHDLTMVFVLLFPLVGAYAGWAIRLGVRKTMHLA